MPEVLEKIANSTTIDVTVTTTTETVAIASDPVRMPVQTCRVLVKGWGQLTTGTGTTAVTPSIRRGTGITGTVVGEANAEQVKAVAGSTELFQIAVVEQRSGEDAVQYALTVKQTGASANGTILQATIEVEVMNG